MDADSGLNALLHFDIVEVLAKRYFHIDSSSGAIKTVMLLDHEKIPQFDFHVKVIVENLKEYIFLLFKKTYFYFLGAQVFNGKFTAVVCLLS